MLSLKIKKKIIVGTRFSAQTQNVWDLDLVNLLQ